MGSRFQEELHIQKIKKASYQNPREVSLQEHTSPRFSQVRSRTSKDSEAKLQAASGQCGRSIRSYPLQPLGRMVLGLRASQMCQLYQLCEVGRGQGEGQIIHSRLQSSMSSRGYSSKIAKAPGPWFPILSAGDTFQVSQWMLEADLVVSPVQTVFTCTYLW